MQYSKLTAYMLRNHGLDAFLLETCMQILHSKFQENYCWETALNLSTRKITYRNSTVNFKLLPLGRQACMHLLGVDHDRDNLSELGKVAVELHTCSEQLTVDEVPKGKNWKVNPANINLWRHSSSATSKINPCMHWNFESSSASQRRFGRTDEVLLSEKRRKTLLL